MIRNPATGGCVSRYGPTGKALVMAKKYEDAKNFKEAYEHAQKTNPGLYENGYSREFNSDAMRARRLQRHQDLVKEMNERRKQMASRSGIYGETAAAAALRAQRTKTWGEKFREIFGQQSAIDQPF